MATPRNYRAEYQRRLERGIAKGLSRAQARGHARSGEKTIKPLKERVRERVEDAFREMRRSGSQAAAAKAYNIAPETLRRFVKENALAERKGRTWNYTDNRPREMTVLTEGEARQVKLAGFDQASLNGQHLAAVRAFVRSNDVDLLRPFEGQSVMDVQGQVHPLETNPNALHRLAAAGGEVFHNIYRLTI